MEPIEIQGFGTCNVFTEVSETSLSSMSRVAQ